MFFTVEGVFCLGSCSIESAGWRPRTFLGCVFLGEGVAGLAAGRDRLTVPHGVGHQRGGLGGGDRFTVLLGLGGGDRLAVLLKPGVGGDRPVVLLCADGGLLRAEHLDQHLAAGGLDDHLVWVGGGQHISS